VREREAIESTAWGVEDAERRSADQLRESKHAPAVQVPATQLSRDPSEVVVDLTVTGQTKDGVPVEDEDLGEKRPEMRDDTESAEYEYAEAEGKAMLRKERRILRGSFREPTGGPPAYEETAGAVRGEGVWQEQPAEKGDSGGTTGRTQAGSAGEARGAKVDVGSQGGRKAQGGRLYRGRRERKGVRLKPRT